MVRAVSIGQCVNRQDPRVLSCAYPCAVAARHACVALPSSNVTLLSLSSSPCSTSRQPTALKHGTPNTTLSTTELNVTTGVRQDGWEVSRVERREGRQRLVLRCGARRTLVHLRVGVGRCRATRPRGGSPPAANRVCLSCSPVY